MANKTPDEDHLTLMKEIERLEAKLKEQEQKRYYFLQVVREVLNEIRACTNLNTAKKKARELQEVLSGRRPEPNPTLPRPFAYPTENDTKPNDNTGEPEGKNS